MENKILRLAAASGSVSSETDEIFRAYKEAGIGTMEVSLTEEKYDVLDWKKLSEYAKEYDIELWSMHLPFQPFEKIDISSTDRDIRSYTNGYLAELTKKACDIGIGTIVIHPSGEPISEENRAERMKYAKESLAALADVAEKGGAVIAVENLPRTCLGRDSKDILELISADERLRVCFDTNHLLGEPTIDFIKTVGKSIITTHFSDYDFKNERHWLPGEGKVNWQELLTALKEEGYKGPLMYEISLITPPSIERRNLTYNDFVDNYNTLMSGKLPSAMGKPIEAKCIYWKDL